VGLALEIPAWALYSWAGAERFLVTWPLAVVAVFVAVPALRRHLRPARYEQPPPLAWSWAVAGIVTLAVGYVWLAYLRGPAPVPTSGTHRFFWDLPYMLSLVGEAKNHFPLQQPQVAGEPLHYHWFTYAHEATASLISGVDTPVVFFRLAIPFITTLAVVLLAVVGYRITGRYWVGAGAAALMFVVGELSPVIAGEELSTVFTVGVWRSHAQAYSWLAMFPLVALVADRLARSDGSTGPRRPSWGHGAWALLALMCFWSSGARATILPVIAGGLGLALVAHLVLRRRLLVAALAVAVPLLAAQAFAMTVLFGFETSGFAVGPDGTLGPYLGSYRLRPMWQDAIVAAFLLGTYLVYMLARVAGAPVLGWFAWRDRRAAPDDGEPGRPAAWAGRRSELRGPALPGWATPEWFLLGALLAGVTATLLFKHPAWSQVIFVRTAFVCGAILSAAGFVALVERRQLPARLVAGCIATAAVVALGVWAVIRVLDGERVRPAFHAMWPIVFNTLGILAVIGAGALLWPVLRRRWPVLRGAGAVLALAIVMTAGLSGTAAELYRTVRAGTPAYTGVPITEDMLAAARWLRANSDPDDVVAVNHQCDVDAPRCPSGTQFGFEAFSERRQLLGSWLYAPRAISNAVEAGGGLGYGVFWDQQRQADNLAAFYAPSAELIERLRRDHGVRWYVVDRRRGTESPALHDLLTLRFERGQMLIFEVRD
jgi:hypothetical protein